MTAEYWASAASTSRTSRSRSAWTPCTIYPARCPRPAPPVSACPTPWYAAGCATALSPATSWNLGHRVVENSHTARTLTHHERRRLDVQTGGRCQTTGCPPRPDRPVIPHHIQPWADATPPASTTPLCCAPAATTTFTSAGRPCAYATADASMNTDRSTSYLTRPAHRAPHRPHSFARYSLVRYSFSCAGKLP